ncbi:MAG: alpha-galactosidase [Eubacteriales bacterium]|nr:alpha-galactosidase [Eubacteriales bacterium]
MKNIEIHENGLYITWLVDEDRNLKLMHFSARPFHEEEIVKKAIPEGFPFIGINLSGFDRPYERHGNKYIVTAPGYRMKYTGHEDLKNEQGRLLIFYTEDEITNVRVKSYVQFYEGLSVIRCWHQVVNDGEETQVLDYISTFHYEGIEKEGELSQDEKIKVWIPHNSWQRELNWKRYSLPKLGMNLVQPRDNQHSSGIIRVSNTGNWSTKEYLPMGFVENKETKTGIFWQIEHNGSWHWEIGDQNGHLYLALGGPNETYSHWFKELKPGDTFTTVPAAIGVTRRGFDDAMGTLTDYRRRIRRKNEDNEKLPVIFNDYMNCLWGNPTAQEEYPLIDAAAEVGCEYFCIDAGWYADGAWWDNVGEWEESRLRFPNGLKEVTDYIRSKGMIPGVWIEPEVMGIHCKLAEEKPDDWFFVRHGKRVYDRSRFQLDYRNPEVRAYMDGVIDRLVREYGIGYLKTDYNIEPGIGTELYADSVGEGLLEHERAYLSWLDGLWERYPDLIIENCSSGGLRMDYAMLSRCSIQSTSDQEDYLTYAVIASNAPTGVTPEQAAVWSYPVNHEEEVSPEQLRQETIFNMVNAMLLRIHQSGHLAKLDEERKALVKEGISVYKQIRGDIKKARPFWPFGLSKYDDGWVSMGLKTEDKAYVAVWKRSPFDSDRIFIPLKEHLEGIIGFSEREGGAVPEVTCIYPPNPQMTYSYDSFDNGITIETAQEITACLFEIKCIKSGDTSAVDAAVLKIRKKLL